MAVDHWWLGATPDHTVATNWSTAGSGGAPGASVPGTGDEVMFDGNGNNPCTLTAHWALLHLTTVVGYTAKLDLATYNLTMDDGGNVTLDQGGEFDCGTGSHSVTNGNFDNRDVTNWTRGFSEWTFDGTCDITGHSTKQFYDLTFSTGSIITINSATTARIAVLHTCTIDGNVTLNDNLAVSGDGDFVIQANANISGSSLLYCVNSNSGHGITSVHANATISCEVRFFGSVAGTRCVPLTTSGLFRVIASGTASTRLELDSLGVYIFGGMRLQNVGTGLVTLANNTNGPASITVSGNLIIDLNSTGDITIDNSGQTVDWDIQGDIIDERTGGGTFTWTKGLGTFTASGSNDQDWDLMDQTVEDIVINKDADTAKLTLTGNVSTDTFTGTQGRFDLNGFTLTSAGNVDINGGSGSPQFSFHNGTDNDMSSGVIDIDGGALTLDGTAGIQLVIDDLDFNLAAGVAGTATYCDVIGSAITRVNTEIDATAGSNVDNGGNSAYWNFAVAFVPYPFPRRTMTGGLAV